jgi:subtilase family serine protease
MTSVLRSFLAFRSPRKPIQRRERARFTVLVLEELERRELPSASGWVALPNAIATPLSAAGVSAVYTPAQIRQAYGYSALPLDGSGKTIAIVDAYDDPNIALDLQYFDSVFGLSAPPAFIKATPEGMPAANAAWAGEIALDVEWAHAIAPKANILLVEARSASDADLLTAVDYARNYSGVSVVSMSWGGPEFFNESSFDSHFTTPAGHIGGGGRVGGITFVASSGDYGAWYGPEWPAVSPDVLAVGGTSLVLSSNGSYSYEAGWASSGGGYSAYVAEPTYQNSSEHTGRRESPDVGYDADPSTGVYVFDSYAVPAGYSGWYSFGGTSSGAPQWAALIALADQGRAQYGLGSIANAQSTIYSLPATDFHSISGGYNGYSVTSGYNPVTGRGSPYADRVVLGLLFGGSSTLTVGGSTGSTSSSGGSRSTIGVGIPIDGDGLTQYAIIVPSGATPALANVAPTLDMHFTLHADGMDHPISPVLTATDEVLRNLLPLSLFGGGSESNQNLIDLTLFGEAAIDW